MKIIIGHKNLNLEELFSIAYLHGQSEVVVDNVISTEFSQEVPKAAPKAVVAAPLALLDSVKLSFDHERAIYLVKLIQLIKLKKNVTKQTVQFFVDVLNQKLSF